MKKTLEAFVLVAALAGCSDTGDASPTEGNSSPPTSAPAEARTPTADDFTLDVRILSKKCTGSAGCAVMLEVTPSVTDPSVLADRTTEVTYELTGIEDAPLTDTITFTGDQYDTEEQAVGIAGSDDEITVTVTDVQTY